ncbi:hypothetical protein Lnau_3065 [Legionella nautarum]|uniref:Uncharacterized protein n=1 Tax=Legionella nautarum TaxID=45070 RepID=A0A0W0WIJ6_9GAMM|nr:hypothetical protein [Legionella nautarum]KTD32154.1 hypothetical protein Lnau_3065 [Legionella nautarum]
MSSQYWVEATFKRSNGFSLAVDIQFDYFIPPVFQDWQDKSFGSIQILQILHSNTKEPIIDLQLDEMITLRRICWDYLEEKKLLITSKVRSLFPK